MGKNMSIGELMSNRGKRVGKVELSAEEFASEKNLGKKSALLNEPSSVSDA